MPNLMSNLRRRFFPYDEYTRTALQILNDSPVPLLFETWYRGLGTTQYASSDKNRFHRTMRRLKKRGFIREGRVVNFEGLKMMNYMIASKGQTILYEVQRLSKKPR